MIEERDKLKVLVTGATGMLGRSLLRHLNEYDTLYTTTGTGFNRANKIPNMKKLDLLNLQQIETIVDEIKPNIVVHCAAERFPDRASADPERTQALNVDSTLNLARECARIGATIIYISTDYVFDGGIHSGIQPPYPTDAKTSPINIYGESKLAGEEAVLSIPDSKPIIVRIPVLYALDCEDLSESASLVVAKALLSTESVTVDNWGVRFPTLVDDVSSVIRLIINATQNEQNPLSKGGMKLHVSSSEQCTKYELTKLMAKIVNVDGSHIQPNSNPPSGAPRPQNTQLDCSATWEVLNIAPYQFVPLNDGIQRALEPFMGSFHR